ncbi:pyridoxal-phosphate dependent enzyme [Actinomadura viridis]|uniref:Diaminopropionate ammonia-lyase n=1 Tax=Actinomadura viridis TaxID=58110 RepID=A0A931DPL9_9ACTN|nr:pyridoxal-phosphate dependent enzyme [Actinomadura viridis]MBG6092383.1 diaminopropionate ammonia-lyase [Actinomadura viridis]
MGSGIVDRLPVSWYARPFARAWRCPPAPGEAVRFHRALPGYAPTPLAEAPELAAELGVERVFVKDESARLGLPTFKILGASWGIHRALARHYGVRPDPAADADPVAALKAVAAAHPPVRLVAAAGGDHGRAVARTARLLGLPAHVFVPAADLAPAASAAIRAEGAELTEVTGPYSEALRQAVSEYEACEAPAAPASGRAGTVPRPLLVPDTAWPGHEDVPQWIVEGYSTLFAEIDDQLRDAGAAPAGLVAVPVGAGSLAQAAVVHHRGGTGTAPAPTLLAVEPEAAPCVLASLVRGHAVSVAPGKTIMAALDRPAPSSLAWPYLEGGLDAAVAVADEAAARAAGDLTALGVPAGPCGGAALAGVRAALSGGHRASLAPGHEGTVVLLSTDGVTA